MIAEIADDVVLGIGLQRAGGLMVNHHTQQVEFDGGKTVPYISQRISGLSKCCKVLADRTVVIPPRKEIPTMGYICDCTRALERVRGSGLVEPSWKGKMGQKGIMVGKDYIPIRLLNTTSEPITIYKGTPAGVVTLVAGEPPVPMETKKIPDFLRPLCKSGSARRRGATHSLCKSGAEQIGGKLQCDQEGAVGGGFLLQIFPALPNMKKVQTMHRSHHLEAFKDAKGMWARWQNTLAEFNKEVVHRAGRSQGNADGLSRRPNVQPERGRSSDSGDPEIQSTESESPEEVEEDITCLRPEENHRVAAVTLQPLWTNAEWRELQKEDPDIALIWTRLVKGEENPRWNEISEFSLATKAYWGEWHRLEMRDGVIYRKWESSDGVQVYTQVLVPAGKRKEILQQAHGERWTAHLGVKRTMARLRETHFWHDMRTDVKSWLAQCGVCNRAKGPGGRTRRNPMTIVRSGTPFERITINMYGPLPETARGNSKILVITCYFTKWVEAYALPDETAETVAEALVNDFVSRYGTPISIHSDQGRNFENTLFQEVCRLLGICKTRTTAYHPEGNGMVDRFNRTMGAMIRSLIGDEHDNWDKILPLILMAYRSSVHEITQQTPHMMLFGREMTVPLALTLSELPTSLVEQDELQHTWDLQEKLARVHRRAREVTGQAMRCQKLQHDRGAQGHRRDVGDLV